MVKQNENKRLFFKFGCLFLFLSLIISSSGFAQEKQEAQKEEEEKVNVISAMKEIEGEVSAINKQGIAIVYKKEAENNKDYEIYLPIDKSLKISHKQSLEQIKEGDTVSVQYEEMTEERKEGLKEVNRTAKVITFLRPSEKKPEVVDEKPEGDGESLLPLKGIK